MKSLIMSFLTMLVLFCPATLQAQGIGSVKFGSAYEEAVRHIRETFGEPTTATADEMVYNDKSFEGFSWNRITFRFKSGRLCEARFYMKQASKRSAKTQLDIIATALGKKHPLSLDYEEDGTRFYAGGRSPLGIGRLFTVFVSPLNGQWSDQLRFGPFKFKSADYD